MVHFPGNFRFCPVSLCDKRTRFLLSYFRFFHNCSQIYREIIKKNKAIVMMRGKSPPSEHVLQKNKSSNSLGFKDDLEGSSIPFFVKYRFVVFIHLYLVRQKTQQISSIFYNKIEMLFWHITVIYKHKLFNEMYIDIFQQYIM